MAGKVEIWAARLWNVFNEGRPFSLVYPLLVLLVLRPSPLALAGALGFAAVLVPFPFPLRGRLLLWLAALASVPLLEPWRAPGLLAAALAGYFAFTVLLWGTLYYRLRTGAPWTNFLRFWRLVLTNSDPTSGNALEQIPKFLMTLSAGNLLAEEPSKLPQIAVAAALTAGLGALAWRRFRGRLPMYPPATGHLPTANRRAKRAYVIVIDGCNRARLRQAHTPTIDRLAREGTEYLSVDPAYPARTVVCFSSMLTGTTPHEHGMRSNFAPRLGVRCESVFDVLDRHGRKGRLVGIAHLLDPFGDRVVRAVTSVQPTQEIDHSLCAEARRAVDTDDPDLLVLQLLAADQLGHVRGVRSPEYLRQLEDTDRRVTDFLAFLEKRDKLHDATVILMADHGQGRGIGGHGHLDWGESPVPFAVWGRGAVPDATAGERRSVLELAPTISALLGIERPAQARGRPLIPERDAAVRPAPRGGRCLAIVVARDEEAVVGRVLDQIPAQACAMTVHRLLVDDGSGDRTAEVAAANGARVISHPGSRGLGAALRTGLEYARDGDYDAAVYIDGDGEYSPRAIPRLLAPVARGRAHYVLGSRFIGERYGMSWHRNLANRALSALLGTLMGTVISDAQTGQRAFSRTALRHARIRHDYNYAQVLTLSLWGAGIEPEEVPVDYRRRTHGRSFVSYPEYLVRVAPALWREWRSSRRARRASAAASAPESAYGHTAPLVNNGKASVSGPNGASGRPATRPPSPTRTSR